MSIGRQLAARIARWCLVAYPVAFRRRFADDMMRTHLARYDALPIRRRAAFVVASSFDLVRSGITERVAGGWTGRAHTEEDLSMFGITTRDLSVVSRILHDLRHAARGLRRSPALSIVAVLSLAFGIAATTTLFSAIDAIDYRPLPFRDASRLVWLTEVSPPSEASCPSCAWSTSALMAADWFSQSQSLSDAAAVSGADFDVADGDVVQELHGLDATPHVLGLLGLSPALGREFVDEDTIGGVRDVALISYAYWQRTFEGRRDVLGMRLKRASSSGSESTSLVTIVGVLPQGFRYFDSPDVWMPLRLVPGRAGRGVDAFARLRPGVERSQVDAEIGVIADQRHRLLPKVYEGWTAAAKPMRDYFNMNVSARRSRVVLFGITCLVLLIAVLNVASLLLARARSRETEFAVRSALGASRYRLAGHLIAEGAVLGLAGGAGGVLLALWAMGLAARWLGVDSTGIAIGVDRRVLLFAFGVSAIVSAISGLLPAMRAIRGDLGGSLRKRGTGYGRGGFGGAQLLVGGQIAVALVVLSAATLLSADFLNARYLDLGYAPANLYSTRLEAPGEKGAGPESWRGAFASIESKLAALPEVESAGVDYLIATHPDSVYAQERRANTDLRATLHAITSEYFTAWGTPITSGRSFTKSDQSGGLPVAIVNEAFARASWPGQTAIGQKVVVSDAGRPNEVLTVVGVVPNIERGQMVNRHWAVVYRPLGQATLYHPIAGLSIRLRHNTPQVISAVQASIREQTGRIGSPLRSEQTSLEARVLSPRLNALAIDLFAAFGILLATIGIYASVTQAMSRRNHEIGIRLALGEQRPGMLARLARDGMRMPVVGVIVGVAGAVWIAHALAPVRREFVTPSAWLLVSAAAVMLATTFIAVLVPANKATGIDPVAMLRGD